MTTYTKSLSTDFGGLLNDFQFHTEIITEISIVPNLIGINHTGDQIDIVFDTPLSTEEQTTLNNLISNHVPNTNKPKNTFFQYTPQTMSSANTSYTRLGTFKYGGSINIGNIDYIDVISYKDANPTNYDIRIFDRTNNSIIAEKLGNTNTDVSIIDLGTISNIPSEKAVFEIQTKRTGGGTSKTNNYVYINQVIVFHGN